MQEGTKKGHCALEGVEEEAQVVDQLPFQACWALGGHWLTRVEHDVSRPPLLWEVWGQKHHARRTGRV